MIISGIYKIENIVNGKVYIGSSINLNKRWQEHKRLLNKNEHSNQKLQNSYNKYGKESFKFSILVKCPEEMLIKMEQLWLDYYKSIIEVYNIAICTDNPVRGCKLSNEHKEKLSIAHLGKHHTEEAKKKMSISRIGKKYSLGFKASDETRKKMSITRKGKAPYLMTEEIKNKIRISKIGKKYSKEINIKKGRKGKVISEETRTKISQNKKGYRPTKEAIEKWKISIAKGKQNRLCNYIQENCL